ncbi:glycosyltransferase family 1 protein [Sulfitobacter sp. S190]|uniref:glycosyltransferase family 4 protein n=1 Tax=Sulfitobacter sp. S190 TaxID=2867022 RepID=UPI0021A8CE42|nr:glycosyltransferase family 1 protein [Sulfitobacter sp. S190]UWR22526.1 glycosyltransferase family 4 protein [Sulfitobacter sp. S190]
MTLQGAAHTPSARLLDVTRLMRRAGRIMTGVDRVERAYLDHLLNGKLPLYGLARTRLGYVLVDRDTLAQFAAHLDGAVPWPMPDRLSRWTRRGNPGAGAAETVLRRGARDRCAPAFLGRMLRRHLPQGTAYLNVGHSNLTRRVLRAVRSCPQARVAVFVHDVIPLDYPQFQRPRTVGAFRSKLRRVSASADLVIYNSADTRRRTERYFAQWGRTPAGIVAHLGTVPVPPDPAAVPRGVQPDEPYFVTLGTIEPRKNHALLLDIWDDLGPDAPVLVICGARGWRNDAVFARLDALAQDERVREVSGLSDGAVSALVAGAQGLLFPSHAEGYGLPVVEAAALGTPVLSNKIATIHEILGDNGVYADVSDRYLWQSMVTEWANRARDAHRIEEFDAPLWDTHFKAVLTLT